MAGVGVVRRDWGNRILYAVFVDNGVAEGEGRERDEYGVYADVVCVGLGEVYLGD